MRRVSSTVLALLGCAALLAPAASAAPGELDPTFGSGGSERLFPSQEKIALRAVAVQPDDKIVLAGSDVETQSILVVRLLRDGAFDPSFGSGGIVRTPWPGGGASIEAVAIQPDGRIVLAGQGEAVPDSDFLAMRYEADGALDPSFGGGDGIELVPLASTDDRAEAVTIGAGGRILLAGEARSPESGVAAEVAVLRPDGAPDPSFGGTGVVPVQTTGAEGADQASGIAEQSDGRIVIADETGNGAGNGFTIVRLQANGMPDPGWGPGTGFVNTPIPTAASPGAGGRSTDVIVQPDGRVVAAGYGFDEGPKGETDSKFAAVRYLPDGEPDPSFGAGASGIFSHQVAGTFDDSARWIALAPSGKLLLGGNYSATQNDDSFALMRLGPAGALDPGYGLGGTALRGLVAPFGAYFEGAALDSRERVVVLSLAYEGGGRTSVEVSRFLGDPGPEPPDHTPGGESKPPPAAPMPKPHARMKKIPRKLATAKLHRFSGTASDRGGALAKVQIAVVKLLPRGARASRAGRKCQVLRNARGRFRVMKVKRGKACPRRWLKAAGTARWRFKLKRTLPPGRYVVYARAVDRSGVAESAFSRAAGNRYGFRLLAH